MTSEAHELIEKAIEREIPISFRYDDLGPELDKVRTLSPYDIREANNKELLRGWSHESEGVRQFDIARVYDIQSESAGVEFVHPVPA